MAIKALPPISTRRQMLAFLSEVGAMAKLYHPRTVLMMGVLLDGAGVSIVSEFVSGGDLGDKLEVRSL